MNVAFYLRFIRSHVHWLEPREMSYWGSWGGWVGLG